MPSPVAADTGNTPAMRSSASLSVGVSIPFLLIHETAGGALEWGEQFMNRPWKVDNETGWATLPEGPGLGVVLDLEKLKKVAASTPARFVWPKFTLQDGSISDY